MHSSDPKVEGSIQNVEEKKDTSRVSNKNQDSVQLCSAGQEMGFTPQSQ